MSTTEPDPKPNAIQRLAITLSQEPGLEPEQMSSAELQAYLKGHRINMASAEKRFGEILKSTAAKVRLDAAREKRLTKLQLIQNFIAAGPEVLQSKVTEMLKCLEVKDPAQALVYAREFKAATPEDRESLAQDIALLDLLDENDGDGRPEN